MSISYDAADIVERGGRLAIIDQRYRLAGHALGLLTPIRSGLRDGVGARHGNCGGIGTVFGAIVGTLLIRVIDNGLVLSRVDANWFKFAIGVLTMFAVIANAWMGKMSRKIKVETRK